MVDINDPLNPVFAGCFAHPNTGRRNTGNSHDTQCVIYHGPDEDYAGREICVNSNETALSVADVTDKDNPIAVATADYPGVQYAHQGWLTEDHRYFYSNDELDEVNGTVEATRTLIWDLADLDDPFLLSEYMNPTKATGPQPVRPRRPALHVQLPRGTARAGHQRSGESVRVGVLRHDSVERRRGRVRWYVERVPLLRERKRAGVEPARGAVYRSFPGRGG